MQNIHKADLTPSQCEGIEKIRNWFLNPLSGQTFTLAGAAGTGKTTLVAAAIDEMGLDENREVAFVSFTGKAALVLAEKGNPNASTIHRLIYNPKYDSRRKTFEFILKRQLDLPFKLLVVDEISMVSETLLGELMSFGIKVLLLGDPYQLPPVFGARHTFFDNPDFLLTEIHRQAFDNPILHFATEIRNLIQKQVKMGKLEDALKLATSNNIQLGDKLKFCTRDELKTTYKPNMLDTVNTQIICGFNETRTKANNWVRKELGFTHSRPMWLEKVICLQNNWEIEVGGRKSGVYLTNGMLGTINETPLLYNNTTLNLWFQPDYPLASPVFIPTSLESFQTGKSNFGAGMARINGKKVMGMTFGYCITCHKSQGSEFPNVILMNEPVGGGADALKWLYTGITRAKDSLIIAF